MTVELTPESCVRAAFRRVPAMAAVWLGFGVILGVCMAPASNPIGIAAGITAGIIVYPPVGVLLALAGGRWRESLLGGTVGLALAGIVVVVGGRPNGAYLAAFGVTFGGLLGGTLLTVAYRLPRLALGFLRTQFAGSPGHADQPVAV